MIGYADQSHMKDLLLIVFQRMNQLYPYQPFQDEVRNIMVTKVVAIFQKWPSFVATMKESITSTMSTSLLSNQVSHAELSLALCWVVGEYASPTINPIITNEIIADYHEVSSCFFSRFLFIFPITFSSFLVLSFLLSSSLFFLLFFCLTHQLGTRALCIRKNDKCKISEKRTHRHPIPAANTCPSLSFITLYETPFIHSYSLLQTLGSRYFYNASHVNCHVLFG